VGGVSVRMIASSRGAAAAAAAGLRCEGFDVRTTHRGPVMELVEVDCDDEDAAAVRQRVRLYDPEAHAYG